MPEITVPVRPEHITDGIITVAHDLGAVQVKVACRTPAGEPVGYLAAAAIDVDRVEVVPAPGTVIGSVTVRTCTGSGESAG
jgi:hypothetical protein